MIQTGNKAKASEKGLLPNEIFNEKDIELEIIPELKKFITECLQVSRFRIYYNVSSS